MERRDLIKDEIERLGRVLGKILTIFLRLKTEGQINHGIEVSNEQLKSRLDIDIAKVLLLTKDELKAYLIERKLTDAQLETLSDYLREVGDNKMTNNSTSAQAYLLKSMELLDLADEISKTVSFERMDKKSRIEGLLMQLEA